MKPPFALSLSFDGIRLLHRAAGGWRVVGQVALDAEDLSAELTALRTAAAQLETVALRTKLLLPNEQIKYLTVPTPDMDDAARRAAAAVALDGATPYAVADLAYDISVDGDDTHIAAVARETLAEAEGFAMEHQFQPVCFAAIPGEQAYLGEPSFGPTAAAADLLAKGDEVEPDGIAVVIIGDVEPPETPVNVEDDDAKVLPAEEKIDAAVEDDILVAVAEPEPELVPEVEAEPEVKTAKASVISPAPPPDVPEPAPENARTIIDPEPPKPAPTPAPEVELPESTPLVGFASRRPAEKAATPALGGATRNSVPNVQEAAVTSGHIEIEPESQPAPPPEQPAARKGFLNRREAEAEATTPAPSVAKTGTERERMTIFGARQAQVRGKPRFLGVMLTTALLLFLAGVAAWASVFLDDGMNLSRLFGDREPQIAETLPEPEPEAPDTEIITAALDPELTAEDTAVLDSLSEPIEPEAPRPLSDTEINAKYAASGIWSRAPIVPPAPAGLIALDDLYLTSIDPVSTTTDAVALPPLASFETDSVLTSIASPAAAGTRFALDAQGLVIPTAQGALSPDGFAVYLGRPPLVPPATPARLQTAAEDPIVRSALAGFRPQPRPGDLAETTERAQLDGLTRSELAGFRPALRPQSLQEQAAAAATDLVETLDTDAAVTAALAEPDPVASATRLAAAASRRPDGRPSDFSNIVKRAEPQQETRVASAAAVAPRVVTPKIPSKASVAKAATTRNAINLRDVNLIGVYGKPSNRRALIRLSNGRYKKVVVGDRVDGGVVSAIGEGELRYTKRGRDLVLKMPR